MKALLLPAVVAAALTGSAQQTVTLASLSPLSGPQAGLGEMIKLGAQLAIEEAKPRLAAAGITLEFSPQDDQASPDTGVGVARRLVNDPKIVGVVGTLNSGVAIPATEVFKDYQLAMVSPANTNPKVTDRNYASVNRVCGRDDVQGPVGAAFAVTDLKAKKIFVVHDKTAYGQGVAEAFQKRAKELGADVVSFTGTEEKSNFQSLILQMKVRKPDLVYFGGIYDQGGVLIKQMRERGVTATFLGPDALDSSELIKIAQGASKGVYYTTVAGPVDEYPAAKAFADAFKAKFGKSPESYALYSYDAANVLVKAIEDASAAAKGTPVTRASVARAVRGVSLQGITGPIAFDGKGDRKQSEYFILLLNEAKYPGAVQKKITSGAP